MFTLSSARGAIANAAQFARGGADAREGRVLGVTVREEGNLLCYAGQVRAMSASFAYDAQAERFVRCDCACGECGRGGWGCRHVAALMIAACGGAGERIGPRDGHEMIEGLLEKSRLSPRVRFGAGAQEPVKLYPVLRRESAQQMALGLRLGRSRTYVVRSMAELSARAAAQEKVVYGRELTFSHDEAELSLRDAALFGQIVLLAGDESVARGGELMLSGAALDQTMRLLDGREAELRGENGAAARVKIVRGALCIPMELTQAEGGAQLLAAAQDIVLGQSGAYQIKEGEIVCAFGEAFSRVAALLQIAAEYPQGVRFEEAQLDAVCTRLILPAKDSVALRKGQAILAAHTPTPATPRLYIDGEGDAQLTCRMAFDYCGQELSAGEEYPHIRRDAALEEDVRAAVQRLFPQKMSEDTYAFEGDDDARFALLSEQLEGLERVGEVHVSRKLTQMHVSKPRAMSFGLSVCGDPDGKGMTLHADLGGFTQEELDAALAAYREKREYVRLTSGTFLSGEALEQAADAAQVLEGLDMDAEQAQAGAEVPMSRAMYLDAALKKRESIKLRAPKAVTQWTQRIEAAQKTAVAQPAGLQATLRSYQLEGLSWLCALSDAGFGGILADDMGLGKTIQVLSMLLREQEMGRSVRALVVCPASLQLNWRFEAQKFAPSLRVQNLTGGAPQRAQAITAEEPPQILITSYDQLRRDVQVYEGEAFTHILLDEAQNIKNAASQAARAVKTLKAEHRFAMTGTPIENKLSELWSIFDFLMPGYLGTYKKFRDRFEAPVVRETDEKARENLHLLVAPFILRRMKADVLTDLPEKVETVMESELTAEQRKLYAAYATRLKKESKLSDSQDRMRVLAGLTRLRQLCCDPRLCLENYKGGSGKLTQLLEVVRDACEGGHKILLFSQFTSMLALIAEALKAEGFSHFLLTGETDKETRMELVQRFNAGEADVFLISLKAGGTGLNLTGADVVIHYDPWWNIAAQNQATDRAYRIGQTKGVQVIRMIANDTVEEYILNIQERKRALGDGVLMGEENLFTIDADLLKEVLGG